MMDILFKIGLAIFVAITAIVLGLIFKGIDRILAARMQKRVGPPILQPFYDVKKLLIKENIVPEKSAKWIFNLMPFVALLSVILVLLYIPFGTTPVLEGYGDLIAVLYILLLPSLAVVLGGFASSSPYAGVGAQREMVKLMSFEFPLAIVSMSVAWLLYSSGVENVFSLSVISLNPVWGFTGIIGFFGLLLLFLTLLFVMPAELGRVPFDVSEADSEIAGGSFVEYSGKNLALFYLADAVKTIAIASLIIALFLPYTISSIINVSGISGVLLNIIFYIFKLFIVIFIGSTMARVMTARLRINQVVSAYWKYSVIISLVGLALIFIDTII